MLFDKAGRVLRRLYRKVKRVLLDTYLFFIIYCDCDCAVAMLKLKLERINAYNDSLRIFDIISNFRIFQINSAICNLYKELGK